MKLYTFYQQKKSTNAMRFYGLWLLCQKIDVSKMSKVLDYLTNIQENIITNLFPGSSSQLNKTS